LENITIPNNITSIESCTFQNCSGLKNITIPDSVTEIGYDAFLNCTSLISITIPNSVTKVEENVFEGCSSLTSVTIPESVTSIGDEAFIGCSSLTEVYCKPTTPPTMRSNYTFNGCSNIKKIYVPSTSVDAYKVAEYWKEYADCFVAYDFEKEEVVLVNNQIFYTTRDGNAINFSGTSLGANVISDTYSNGVGVITCDATITSIGVGAFSGYTTLNSITIPSSVTLIENNAFNGCSYLTEIFCKCKRAPSIAYISYNGTGSLYKVFGMKIYVPRESYDHYMSYTEAQVGLSAKNWYGYREFIRPYDYTE
jgi:hypothetical protein